MRLYVVQHGHAVPKEVDPERPLSEQGRGDVVRVAACLARAGVRAERVVHSGKIRALQTAEILGPAIAPGVKLEVGSGIDPTDDPANIARQLEAWGRDAALVGHMPFVAGLVSRMAAGKKKRQTVAFTPGSVVCLERGADTRWAIAWMLRPELLPAD